MSKKIPCFLLLLASLSSCSNNLSELKDANIMADDFASSLAADYLSYSESEKEQGRAEASEYFALKGLNSLKGDEVLPDAAASDKLADTRDELISFLREDVKKSAFDKLAISQVLFDCWNAEQKRAVAKNDAVCTDAFAEAFSELKKSADKLAYGKSGSTTVFFAEDSSELGDGAKTEIAEFAKKSASKKNAYIALNAHYNQNEKLTEDRLAAVKSALLEAGILEAKIKTMNKISKQAVYLSSDEEIKESDGVDIRLVSERVHNKKNKKHKKK